MFRTVTTHHRWLIAVVAMVLVFTACRREPPLHLHRDNHIMINWPRVKVDLKVFWDYDDDYDWEAEWTYGWDSEDRRLFGPMGYTDPEYFHLYRYYLDQTPNGRHTRPKEFEYIPNSLTTEYRFGYYDLLARNEIDIREGVQSIIFDEETTFDSVMVFTNQGSNPARYNAPAFTRAFHQPEELFAAYYRNLYISGNPKDYDYYDPIENVYYKNIEMVLQPITYIYLTQVRLHNNRGRISGVDGDANFSGMARGATLNTGNANKDAITVHYYVRFKRDLAIHGTGERVDVAGGRCTTFGIPNQNSARLPNGHQIAGNQRHYMDVHFLFNNGMDSTIVFDITNQVRRRFRGGVITVDLDMDTVPIPTRPGGSGFDAVVKNFDEETFEIPM